MNKAGFSTKLVKFKSFCTPVVTNKTSNIGDYLINGKNDYLMERGTIEDFAKELNEIFINITGIKTMKNILRKQDFFLARTIQRSLKVF